MCRLTLILRVSLRPAPERKCCKAAAVDASPGVLLEIARSGALRGASVDLRGTVSRRRAHGLSGLQPGDAMSQGWRDGESSTASPAFAGLAAVGGESSGTMKSS